MARICLLFVIAVVLTCVSERCCAIDEEYYLGDYYYDSDYDYSGKKCGYRHCTMVALLYFRTFKTCTSLEVKCEIYSCALEPHSTDSLGHQHRTKKLSPEIALHLK